jgi:hypothetical protein
MAGDEHPSELSQADAEAETKSALILDAQVNGSVPVSTVANRLLDPRIRGGADAAPVK